MATGSVSSPSVRLFGTTTCSDCKRARTLLEALKVPFIDIDIASDASAADEALSISGRTSTPVILYPDGTHQVEPTNAELEAKVRELGLVA
jgi:glutaredoxin